MAHVTTAEWGFHCQACFWPDTTDMVNCAHCLTWWHTCCAGVDETVPVEERSFTCPRCQNPSFTVPKGKKPPSKASSGTSSTSDARARRARLRLEKLEAQRLLMEKHLEQARREQQIRHEQEKLQQEAEIDRAKLEIEQTILEETFRAREEELDDEVADDRSVGSEQSSKSKVEQWQKQQQFAARTSTLTEQGANNNTTGQYDESAGQDVLGRALQGISLDQSTLEVGLGGMIDRTSSTLGTIYEVDPYDNPGYTNWQQAGPSHGSALAGSAHLTHSTPFPFSNSLLYQKTLTVRQSQSGMVYGSVSSYQVNNASGLKANGNNGTTTGSPGVNPTPRPESLPPYPPPPVPPAPRPQPPGPTPRPPGPFPRPQGPFPRPQGPFPRPQGPFPPGFQPRPPFPFPRPPVPRIRPPGPTPAPEPAPVPPNPQRDPEPVPPNPQRNPEPAPPDNAPEYQPEQEQQPIPPVLGPTPQQLAARHVMPRGLPKFSGNPEDWPLFVSCYNNSTQTCGYSDAENLARLQDCLEGHAREMVVGRLRLPASVPHVLATLETLYGRPELLIQTLLQKLRSTPGPKPNRLETLIAFGMVVQSLSDHLEDTGQDAHLNNPTLLFEMVEKLPDNMKLDWSLYKNRFAVVNVLTFAQYMNTLVRAATDVTPYNVPKPSEHRDRQEKGGKEKHFCGAHAAEKCSSPKTPAKKVEVKQNNSGGPACLVCKDPKHRVKDCPEFAKKSVDDRWKVIEQHELCRCCLGAHGRRPCKLSKRCEENGCQLKHHPLLHSKPERKDAKQNKEGEQASGSKVATNHHFSGKTTLFRVLPVTLHANNRSVQVYAFLDDGSESTLIEEEVVKQLGVEGEHLPLCLQWTANMKRTEAESQRVTLQISGGRSGAKHTISDVRTVSKLDLPRQSLRYSTLVEAHPYLKGLPVDDYDRATPCILIGNDNVHVTATLRIREGKPGEPVAAKTRLGWTIYGTNPDRPEKLVRTFNICECHSEDPLHDLVARFFSIESLGISAVPCPESEEVQRANRILQETTARVGQRFETGLLWKFDHFEFPDSYGMAVRRLQCLERRIRSDPVIGESVLRQMNEYQEKGYIHKATEDELKEADPRRVWYLPLGVALNPKKPSKVRIFCDAAAKVDGISLNTMLLKGPDLLTTLPAVLFGFRERQIALCADIKEMFHQVQIRKEDRHAQRLLWRENPSLEPDIFLMDVATFGSTCSPCSAQFVKNLNAAEHAEKFPAAAEAIQRKHYVDDYLDSADNEEEAVKLALEVKHVHSLGGFHLRNWLSNSEAVLARVGDNDSASEKNLQLDKGSTTERVLGLYWKQQQDVFTFSSALDTHGGHPTKRQSLSTVMSTFDPLGFLAHFTVRGKILIQALWRAKTQWDQRIPDKMCVRWTQWTDQFKFLEQIRIPRCYFPRRSVKDIKTLQLHIFVDASEDAFSCVAYFRAEFEDGIEVALVGGKSKVAPLKALSIPRLELMAAVIGVRLMNTIIFGHSLRIDKTIFWCDSKTVLAWINSDHRNYRQFVACRVGEIMSKTMPHQWRWIPSKENVADDATKWGKSFCLSPDSRWFKGPWFLYHPEDQWPVDITPNLQEPTEELRACLVHREAVATHNVEWDRFSQWVRLLRTLARVHRFAGNLRRKLKKEQLLSGPLRQEELAAAENTIWRWVQSDAFPDEVATLAAARADPEKRFNLESTSKIRKLSPFMDDAGVVRMESRIVAADFVPFDTRYPIIMPKDHTATKLLVDWYHRKYLHGNCETVVNELRQRFHVPNLRTAARKAKNDCLLCQLKAKVPVVPRMAPLPAARLKAFERPFSYVGVDYFGPVAVRVNRTTAKRWVALFTCLTTRAVHLEVVHSLSAESCKMSFRRLIARRGAPVEIYSDRGTNFVGSSNELQKEMKVIEEKLAETFTNATTKWVFNPPASPHMGGAWERLVRSVKTALAAMNTVRLPNEETLATLVAEAESIVNSRPLTWIPLEAEHQEALTPNHFLLLSTSGVVQTQKTLADSKDACRNQWNLMRVMIDQFWRRWVREYLPDLTRRTKWHEEVVPIRAGDLVIIVEDTVRNGWIRGRVAEVVVGRDGRVRQAVVQTSTGMLRRPIAKLARLDVEKSEADPVIPEVPHGSGNVADDNAVPLQAPRTTARAPRRSEAPRSDELTGDVKNRRT
ncbi:uncharacterized protein LOC128092673 [Culex pipiens pallens]|uniref:uncharacterized protein LOC128092673 n=1 Tax=Culex pipiens pallens TaxID=42434 RepID=UPI0022AB140B|nr:uncharacterized protein LOC128092673 [Culex pipiens pallens]